MADRVAALVNQGLFASLRRSYCTMLEEEPMPKRIE